MLHTELTPLVTLSFEVTHVRHCNEIVGLIMTIIVASSLQHPNYAVSGRNQPDNSRRTQMWDELPLSFLTLLMRSLPDQKERDDPTHSGLTFKTLLNASKYFGELFELFTFRRPFIPKPRNILLPVGKNQLHRKNRTTSVSNGSRSTSRVDWTCTQWHVRSFKMDNRESHAAPRGGNSTLMSFMTKQGNLIASRTMHDAQF